MSGPTVQCDFAMTGVLVTDAEARTRNVEGGPLVPVLCLHLEIDTSPTRPHAFVEQMFPVGQGAQCEAAARRYKRGARVTFHAPSIGVQLLVRNASHLHLVAESGEADQTAATAEAAAA